MRSITSIIVRYAETDRMGIAHHSHYAVWFEQARTDWIKQLGMTYTQMEEMGILVPLVELQCRYRRPAHYEDVLEVETCLSALTRAKLEFSYTIRRQGDPTILCTGKTIHGIVGKGLRPLNLQKAFPEVFDLLHGQVQDSQEASCI